MNDWMHGRYDSGANWEKFQGGEEFRDKKGREFHAFFKGKGYWKLNTIMGKGGG